MVCSALMQGFGHNESDKFTSGALVIGIRLPPGASAHPIELHGWEGSLPSIQGGWMSRMQNDRSSLMVAMHPRLVSESVRDFMQRLETVLPSVHVAGIVGMPPSQGGPSGHARARAQMQAMMEGDDEDQPAPILLSNHRALLKGADSANVDASVVQPDA